MILLEQKVLSLGGPHLWAAEPYSKQLTIFVFLPQGLLLEKLDRASYFV